MSERPLPRPHLEDVIANGWRSLVLASGGLDSGYVLWRLANETSETIHIHHIDLGAEQEAAQEQSLFEQMQYLGPRRFSVHKSSGGDGSADFWAASRASIPLAKDLGCDVIVTGDDLIARNGGRSGLSELISEITSSGLQYCIGGSSPSLAEAYRSLPEGFPTWSCCTPIVSGNVYKRCGWCQQCITHKQHNLWSKFNQTQRVPLLAAAE